MRACEGLPVHARLGVGSTNGPALLTFASTAETQSLSAPSRLLAVRPANDLAAARWMVRRSRTPLMGLSKFAPPSASVPGVHSWRRRCSEERLSGFFPREVPFQRGVAFGPELPRSGLVPPLSFLPTAAACSTWHFSGLLRPETDHGVRHVSGVQVRCGQHLRSSGACAPLGLGPAGAFRRSPGGRAALAAASRAPESRCGSAAAPVAALGFPWPFPVASHPSELSPPQQLYRVNRAFRPRSACRFPLGEPRTLLLTGRDSAFWPGSPRPVPSRRCSPLLPSSPAFLASECA
jgi:hypothetical protein